ncbi:sugar ABC transporter substrate-binding protein [Xylanibacillus composti]|uniref:ABC transporter substrate-binding protein n=1 Tax=Xylanibacillus composti TaxID=1572762 RepID=A0A8J4M0S2_9BACL|nr:ABC transporter substrate-binding protein [Xylanibacillus composti]MDT9726235.1 sugar ABC transporter substrate-binding protein [Xylanibacillus composti]GIQ68085.1 ABC transporter substrate-binding protein [Xylanibacillus composti]
MKMKLWLPLLLAAIMIVSAGCGSANNGGTGNGTNNTGSTSGNAGESTNDGAANNADEPAESYKIAIAQYVEHPSLDATREGFLAALADAGLIEGENLEVDFNNAQADSTNNLSIAQKLASQSQDLVLAIATPTAQAVAQQVQNSPVLFAAVTDPLEAKLVDNLEAPGGNVSGASDTNPEAIKQLMDFIAAHVPDVETVGIVINEGEPNAVVMAGHAEAYLAEHGIGLVRAAVTNTSEVKQAAESLIGRADAIYITLDNSVVSAVASIVQVANDNDIPFFSSDRDTVEAGAFATVGFKYYDHGYEAGEMAVEVLKNGANIGDLPVTKPSKLDFIMNLSAAAEQGLEVTDEMKGYVQDPENNIIE